MDFELSEEQRAIAETTRRFVEKEMPRQQVLQWSRDKVEPPQELFRKLGKMGYYGFLLPEAYSGLEKPDPMGMLAFVEQLRGQRAGPGAELVDVGSTRGLQRLRSLAAQPAVKRVVPWFLGAAAIGGTLLTGGYGSVIGASFGAMIAAMLARVSTMLIISSHTVPAGTWPGQRTIQGTFMPPSQCVCLPPRCAPLLPIWLKRSPPLPAFVISAPWSLLKTTIVLSRRPSLSSSATIC